MASANELRNFVLQRAFELRGLMKSCCSLYMKLHFRGNALRNTNAKGYGPKKRTREASGWRTNLCTYRDRSITQTAPVGSSGVYNLSLVT